MDGLIKGLIDVALGQGGDGDSRDHHRRDDDSGPQSRDERSRSSWAEVVSGDQDGSEESGDRRSQSHGYGRNQWNSEEQSDHRRQEDWPNVDSRPPRRNQKTENEEYGRAEDSYGQSRWSRKEEDENNEDGWETVGKKPPRRSHKVQKDNWGGFKRPANEQQYSDEVEVGGNINPTEEELSDLSQACNKLWELDTNRLVPGKDYEIDCGEGKKVFQRQDMAGGSLFNWLDEDIFRRPTFSRFCSLLDNYNPNEGSKEVVTSEEREEQAAFIEEISRTAPIKYLYKYLSSKGIVSGSFQDYKRMLTSLWFDLYGRGGTSGSSSAFEHVFVGEVKQRGEQEISGFHNWLQFYLEEAKGRVDYQGYIFPRRRGESALQRLVSVRKAEKKISLVICMNSMMSEFLPLNPFRAPDSETQLLTIQFEWNGILKSVSSTLVGVSPEFEIALYTLCFYAGGEENHVQLGPYSVNIKCYRLGDRIGSAFPVSEC